MTPRESQLLFGILALQLNYISKEQLISCASLWMDRPTRSLEDIIIERKYLTKEQSEALGGLVSAHLARTTGRGLPKGATPDARELLDTILVPKTGGRKPPPKVSVRKESAERPADKFVLGPEIGRGGLARVVEATDSDIGRQVALKLMLEDAPGDALERFRWEAKITGQLEHPNIVPVHEVGMLPGSKEIYFCMKRILGRDMHQVIREGSWKPRRLVEAFRDVCRAVAYAHAKGVVHRDLKPANIMLGDFGETLVVDWGLAVIKGEGEPPLQAVSVPAGAEAAQHQMQMVRPSNPQDTRPITEEGEILGTPAYMSPEQAKGHRREIDEKSDVYSLGAILYEILTARPPFEGRTAQEVVKKVAHMPLMPPSARVSAVPPELEAICLKAMSRRKEDRYPGAAELAADIELYLEGTKEKERREKLAEELVERGRRDLARWRRLAGDARKLANEARLKGEKIPEYEPAEVKKAMWQMEDEAKALERDGITAFTEANGALTSALSNIPGHAEARRLKAEMFWEKFLEAEEAGDEKGMLLNRQTAEQFNDGVLDARLRGDGTLAVRTRVYNCPCLRHGRSVRPEEFAVLGYHPWSGRPLASPDSDTPRDMEPAAPVPLRVHAADCAPSPLPGAQAWAFRIEEIDRVLVPVTPHGGETPVPRAVIERLFGNSPYRPRGGGVYLGRTPIPRQPWPMGSWLLILVAEGRAPQRVPFFVARQEEVDLDITLFAPEEIPRGFLPVSAGPFRAQGDRESLSYKPAETKTLDDFLIAATPATCREYLAFLEDLRQTDPAEAALRVPRAGEKSGYYWPLDPDRGYVIPTADWLAKAPEALKSQVGRLMSAFTDWEEDWPVTGISWEDMSAYARWSSMRQGWLLHLPHEDQWEKAARGADGRPLPWGTFFDASRCNMATSRKAGMKPQPVDSFPSDESPYGVRGLGGNVSDRCLNEPSDSLPGRRITRGGSWTRSGTMARATYRSGGGVKEVHMSIGVRLTAAIKISPGS